MIPRILYKYVLDRLFKGKVILLYGARQTGKTTLVKHLLSSHQGIYLNADEPDVRANLSNRTSTELNGYFGVTKLVVIDEAQRIDNVGMMLKLMSDQYPEIQIIATGSSNFELADRLKEPLTGRKFECLLSPLSLEEIEMDRGPIETDRFISQAVLYGMYPEPALAGIDEARERLQELGSSYLYKDILLLGLIRNPDALEKILRALALQLGSEVSYSELSGLVGLDKTTVETYIRILEQSFIVFRLPPYSTNRRNEMKKQNKVYFWDNGIRNAVINKFNPIELRTDTGALWENFFISERMKYLRNHRSANTSWFWRTYQQQEVDYIEERATGLLAAEIKTNTRRHRLPRTFTEAYPDSTTLVVSRDNWRTMVYAAM